MNLWRLAVWLCLLMPLSITAYAASGNADIQRINAIKAAFVLNIARFVTWPPEAFSSDSDPVRLCVYRDNAYGHVLDAIEGKKIGKRRIKLFTIDHLKPKVDCEILLIPSSAAKSFAEELNDKLQQPLLTISDQTGGNEEKVSRKGIIVTLVRQGSRIAFEIDPLKARRVNLHMSSELLKLAKIVGEEQ